MSPLRKPAGTVSAPNLRFVGHFGEITQPKNTPLRAMFVLDANLVLVLLNNSKRLELLPQAYKDFLLASRSRVRLQWHERERYIPVNAVIAVLELSKQDERRDYARYADYYQRLMQRIYQIDNVDPAWIEDCYLGVCAAEAGLCRRAKALRR